MFLKGNIILHEGFKVLSLLYHVLHRLLAMPKVVPGVSLQLVTQGTKQTVANEQETTCECVGSTADRMHY